MISQISQCVWFLTKAFYCAFPPRPISNGCFCGAVGMEDWRHTCFSYFAKSKTVSKRETSHKPWSRCASVWIFFVDGVWTPLYAPSLYFSFFLDKGLSFLSSLFFDMPKYVAYLLWVCIFYSFFFFLTCRSMWHTFFRYASFIFFLHSPISSICFLRERCHTWTWSFILWMDGYLLTSSVEA